MLAARAEEPDAPRPDRTVPEALFPGLGRYRFAMVNGIDAAPLKANEMRVSVTAACTFDWTS